MISRSSTRNAAALLALALLAIALPALAAQKRGSAPATNAWARFYTQSDLQSVRTAAQSANAGAPVLFAAMEAAALQLEPAAELDYALRLCERWGTDPRADIAASRVLDLAANTPEFRTAVPRIRALLKASAQANTLRAALIAAADDGLPGVDRAVLARESGLLTDWRVAGPFGRFANVAFEKSWPAVRDALAGPAYDGRPVEQFRFANGTFRLPDYFSADGVLVAASTLSVNTAEARVLRVESPGTLEVLIDGESVLTKDDRLETTPETVSQRVRLAAGEHRVVLKFLTSAVPFRVAFVPEPQPARINRTSAPSADDAYVSAAAKYWAGDYDGALVAFKALASQNDSAGVELMLARSAAQSGDETPPTSSLDRALKLAPQTLAADVELARIELEHNEAADALTRVKRLAQLRPAVANVQELLARAAMAANAQADAKRVIQSEVQLHPSCAVLSEAARFLSNAGDADSAQRVQAKLDHCAPESLSLAKALADAGHHAEAAHAADAVARDYPLNREARALAVKELLLAGDTAAAKQRALELTRLAPNSHVYAALSAEVSNPAADPFATRGEFYRPFRRDGISIVRQTSERRFSGGPSVTLLDDRVVNVDDGGGATVYVHKVTRVLNRDGIEADGEVPLPSGAEIIELRTIKPELTTAEPELNPHKASASMPALAPGDAIDVEYVYRVTDLNAQTDVLQFTFGSFTAPIVMSRFVVIAPAAQELRTITTKDAPAVVPGREGATSTQYWERNDIAQSRREISAAPDSLPYVRVSRYANWTEVRDLYRDALIDSVHDGPKTQQLAAQFTGADEQRARAIYNSIKAKVRSAGIPFTVGDLPSAETTLLRLSGNRSVTAIAVARAAGLKADLLLARDLGRPWPAPASLTTFTRPLVLFTLDNGTRKIAVDMENDGIAFGAIPPNVSITDALYVPVLNEPVAPIASIPQNRATPEESVATGDVTIAASGDLSARVVIRMGSSRGMQMRSVLGGIDAAQRPHFFEQLAARIFPGATNTRGSVRNERSSEQPLEIEFSCTSPGFLTLTTRTIDMEQLVPALGLRKMYAIDSPRALPLYLETPLIERATFRVHLPEGISVASNARDLDLHSDFGDYSATFRIVSPTDLEITRAFRLPVQVIPADRFSGFASFARQIDDTERQRITLAHSATPAVAQQ